MRVFNWIVTGALLLLALFVCSQESVLLPSRYGPQWQVQGAGVYLVAGFPLAISLAIALELGFDGRYKPIGLALLCAGVFSFLASIFFVA